MVRLPIQAAKLMAPPSGHDYLRGLRVLVVEDELLIRWSITETLEGAGSVVTEAADGASAIEALSSSTQPIDAVVLDYRLPDSNDLDLLTRIRSLRPTAIVVMMTAFGTPDMIQRALEMGVYDVLEKPFEMETLVRKLAAAFAARRTR